MLCPLKTRRQGGRGWSLARPLHSALGPRDAWGRPETAQGKRHKGLRALVVSQILRVFERSLTLSGLLGWSRVKPGTTVPPRAWALGRRQALTDGQGHQGPAQGLEGRERSAEGYVAASPQARAERTSVGALPQRVKHRGQLPAWLDAGGLRSRHGKAGGTLAC